MGQKYVIHLYLKATKEHRFFGSVAALCSVFPKDKLGIQSGALTNYFWKSKNAPFENEYCVIYRGILERHLSDNILE